MYEYLHNIAGKVGTTTVVVPLYQISLVHSETLMVLRKQSPPIGDVGHLLLVRDPDNYCSSGLHNYRQ